MGSWRWTQAAALAGDKLEPYPVRNAGSPGALLPERIVNSNKLLRDRDGGLWIGTKERGLLHVHDGQADCLYKGRRPSGNTACSLFEDREGNIWFASSTGLDRFRELPVVTIFVKQGLSSDATKSVLATTDGAVWVATLEWIDEVEERPISPCSARQTDCRTMPRSPYFRTFAGESG